MSQDMKNKVFILHCENANPEQHWYIWLEQQLKSIGIAAERVVLADSSHPDAEVWQTCLEAQLNTINQQSILVAHGLSCLAAARYLADKLKGTSIKAALFLAGFNETIPQHPEWNQFIQANRFESKYLRTNILRRIVFFSSNDPVVPVPYTFKFAHHINAQLIEVSQAGHFCEDDGYREFEHLFKVIQTLVVAELT